MSLSKRGRDILDVIERYTAEHVQRLEHAGYLRRQRGVARSLEVLDPGAVAQPAAENDYTIPPGARYVPVSALPALFRVWLERRQVSA